ncbi:MAG: efflux RND transporter periplasmic adaptor subunit [Candidatus Acidiferrales bacterium]
MTRRTQFGLIAGVALLVAILLAGLAGRDSQAQVRVAQAVRENLAATITSNGKVEPIVPHELRAQVNTFVRRVIATEGQRVGAGQLLAELDSAEIQAEVARLRNELLAAQDELRAARTGGAAEERAQLEADLKLAEAQAARWQRDVAALERLQEKQAASQAELDNAKLELAKAQENLAFLQTKRDEFERQAKLGTEMGGLRVQRAQAALREAEQNLRSTRVTAPVDGTLYALPIRTGQYMRVGELLAEMADLSRVRVRAFVDEPELGWLEKGQPVEITWDALPGRTWSGQTEAIPKTVVPRGTRSVGEVLCSVENAGLELLPNINVNVRIRVRERANALVVPRAAVHTEGSERVVFLLEGNTLRRRTVKVGITGATSVEIVEGLSEGDRVALPGEVPLRDGMDVDVVAR